MSDRLTAAEDAAVDLLSIDGQIIERSLIEARVRDIAAVMGIKNENEINEITKRIEARFDVSMSLGTIFSTPDYRPWLDDARVNIEWFYSDRYKRYLRKKEFPPMVIRSMDSITDQILDHLEDPGKDGAWDRRGMVVGYVQSGKTANYIQLISKAADAGYRVIIVLAGMLNALRNQTQRRIDRGFIGIDTESKQRIGVGRISVGRRPAYFTTNLGDFSKGVANQIGVGIGDLIEPVVFVIKKNKSTFDNLIDWLKHNNPHNLQDYPMLLIDDEADHASINTNKEGVHPTTINIKIRELLKLFDRSSYVGYTATPFANVFIDPETEDEMLGDDLFPRDFIISLDPPSNYLGPEHVFSEAGELELVRTIDDYEDLLPLKHKKDLEPWDIPESLKKAIVVFVLIRTIRLLRGHEGMHHSMMINVSRFTRVQTLVKLLVTDYLNQLRRAVSNYYRLEADEAIRNSELKLFRDTFLEEFGQVDFCWSDVQFQLKNAISPIGVIEVNSSNTSERLNYNNSDYPNGRNVIAVGGLSLSRGMTLEGLSVSYFLRNSSMYDTLMQMGRWFGYRDGYSDLCRVYMPAEAASWYAHISEATEELRTEFARMKLAGMTPRDFGLCVRSHPQSLIVTARNKMRTGTKVLRAINLEGRLIETSVLLSKTDVFESNFELLKSTIKRIKSTASVVENKNTLGYIWANVPLEFFADFVEAFINHPAAMLTDAKPIKQYLEILINNGILTGDVLLPRLSRKSNLAQAFEGLDIYLPRRTVTSYYDHGIEFNKRRVGEAKQEAGGLSAEEIYRIEEEYGAAVKTKSTPGAVYRSYKADHGGKPLLILHLLDCVFEGKSIREGGVAAFGISFPGKAGTRRPENLVEYVVNTIWWRNEFQYLIEEEDDIEDE